MTPDMPDEGTRFVHWFDQRHKAIICATSWCQARWRGHRTLWDRDPERVTCPDCRERARDAEAEGFMGWRAGFSRGVTE